MLTFLVIIVKLPSGWGVQKKKNFTPPEECKGMTTINSSSEMICNGKHEKKVKVLKNKGLFYSFKLTDIIYELFYMSL